MKQSYYIFNNGDICRHDNTFRFINDAGDKRDFPVERVADIYFMSEISLNSSFINFAAKNGINLHFFNYYSFYTGSFYPKESLVSGNLLVKQVEHYTDVNKRLEIAKEFVSGAIDNIYRNLRYYNERDRDLKEIMLEISSLGKSVANANNIKELMGYEGNARKFYYKAWSSIIAQGVEFDKRVKNPPDNMVNTLISFVNMLVYTRVLSEIYHTQLNPTVSYLHEPGTRRFSLSLDIAEIFKPLIGDRLIFTLLNRQQITEKSFTSGLNYLHLTQQASKTVVEEFDKRLKQTIKHKELGREVSYSHLIRLECYKLVKHLLGEKPYSAFRLWW